MSSTSEPYCQVDIPYREDPNITLRTLKTFKNIERFSPKYSFVCFGPPYNKIVISQNRIIRIFHSRPFKLLKTIRTHPQAINDLIRFRKSIYLSASDDGNIRTFSIRSPKFRDLKVIKTRTGRPCLKLLKLDKNFFLCRYSDSRLIQVRYSNGEVLKRWCVGILHSSAPIILSEIYEYCFYCGTNDDDKTIKLVNYRTEQVIKEFKNHPKENPIYSACIFRNSKNQEMLVACDTSERIHFYNTSHPQFNTKIYIVEIDFWRRVGRSRRSSVGKVRSSFCLKNKYLVVGDISGFVHFYQIWDNSLLKLKKLKVHNSSVEDLEVLRTRSFDFRLVTCSPSKEMVKVIGVSGIDDFVAKDLKERLEFICFEVEGYYFEEKKMLVDLKMYGNEFPMPMLFLRNL